jgi:hypothetical protein
VCLPSFVVQFCYNDSDRTFGFGGNAQRLPLLNETGNYFDGAGNFGAKTGNFTAETNEATEGIE